MQSYSCGVQESKLISSLNKLELAGKISPPTPNQVSVSICSYSSPSRRKLSSFSHSLPSSVVKTSAVNELETFWCWLTPCARTSAHFPPDEFSSVWPPARSSLSSEKQRRAAAPLFVYSWYHMQPIGEPWLAEVCVKLGFFFGVWCA